MRIAFAACVMVLAMATPAVAAPHDHHGGGGAAGTDLQTILDDAAPGSRVVLDPVGYHGSFVIRKPLTIEGNGATLHGDGSGSVLTIRSDDVTVTELSISHSAPGPVGSPAGIDVKAARVSIADVHIADSYMGIRIRFSQDVTIENVVVEGRQTDLTDADHALDHSSGRESYGRADMAEGRGDGIVIASSRRTSVRDSVISGTRDGFYLNFARGVLIDRTSVSDSRYAVHSMYASNATIHRNSFASNVAGIVLMYGRDLLVLDNHLFRNRSASTGFGVLAKDVTGLEVAKNVVEENRIGIHVEGPAGEKPGKQRFILNTVALNGAGLTLMPTASVTFSGNSFVENHLQVVPQGGNPGSDVRWSEEGAGNYWSDYRGFDRDGDGVGDVAHSVPTASSELLEDNPALYGLMGSPALNMTIASQQRWADGGVVVDELPLMSPHSPSARVAPKSSFAFLAGSALVGALAAAALLFVGRRRVPVLRNRRVPEVADAVA